MSSFGTIGVSNHSIASNNPWSNIKQFSMELLVEQVISSAAPMPVSPGDGFRRMFESIAGTSVHLFQSVPKANKT